MTGFRRVACAIAIGGAQDSAGCFFAVGLLFRLGMPIFVADLITAFAVARGIGFGARRRGIHLSPT